MWLSIIHCDLHTKSFLVPLSFQSLHSRGEWILPLLSCSSWWVRNLLQNHLTMLSLIFPVKNTHTKTQTQKQQTNRDKKHKDNNNMQQPRQKLRIHKSKADHQVWLAFCQRETTKPGKSSFELQVLYTYGFFVAAAADFRATEAAVQKVCGPCCRRPLSRLTLFLERTNGH